MLVGPRKNNRATDAYYDSVTGGFGEACQVQAGEERRIFLLHKTLAIRASEFFEAALDPRWSDGRPIDMTNEDPFVFAAFVDWLESGRNRFDVWDASKRKEWNVPEAATRVPYGSEIHLLICAYSLGDMLLAPDFRDAVVSELLELKYTALDPVHVDHAYTISRPGSTIRRAMVEFVLSEDCTLSDDLDPREWNLDFLNGRNVRFDELSTQARPGTFKYLCDIHEHDEPWILGSMRLRCGSYAGPGGLPSSCSSVTSVLVGPPGNEIVFHCLGREDYNKFHPRALLYASATDGDELRFPTLNPAAFQIYLRCVYFGMVPGGTPTQSSVGLVEYIDLYHVGFILGSHECRNMAMDAIAVSYLDDHCELPEISDDVIEHAFAISDCIAFQARTKNTDFPGVNNCLLLLTMLAAWHGSRDITKPAFLQLLARVKSNLSARFLREEASFGTRVRETACSRFHELPENGQCCCKEYPMKTWEFVCGRQLKMVLHHR